MLKRRKRAHRIEGQIHTCPTCTQKYEGHYCNNCGEKESHPHDLSLVHLLEDAVDKFTHFDLKIPKSILLLFNPGYLTEKFLKGIRKPFANPVQLFLIANVIFFLFYKSAKFSDFTPSWGDDKFYKLSGYTLFFWAKPIDDKLEAAFDEKANAKWGKLLDTLDFDAQKIKIIDTTFQRQIDTARSPNHFLINALLKNENNKIVFEKSYRRQIEGAIYKEMARTSATYSKSLLFLLILLITPFVYFFYRKSFKTIGATLIFCTHFVGFYILAFGLNAFLYAQFGFYITAPLAFIYDSTHGVLRDVINILFGNSFELCTLFILITYLFIACRRLFKPNWGYNLFAAYSLSRIFFFLCFGVYKKIILWIAISNY
jgi:hypothetical protein